MKAFFTSMLFVLSLSTLAQAQDWQPIGPDRLPDFKKAVSHAIENSPDHCRVIKGPNFIVWGTRQMYYAAQVESAKAGFRRLDHGQPVLKFLGSEDWDDNGVLSYEIEIRTTADFRSIVSYRYDRTLYSADKVNRGTLLNPDFENDTIGVNSVVSCLAHRAPTTTGRQ